MEDEIKIKRANNGFIVSYPETWDDGTKHQAHQVFTDGKYDGSMSGVDDEDELEALARALHIVKEQLGYFYSKHKKINLKIETEKNEDNN